MKGSQQLLMDKPPSSHMVGWMFPVPQILSLHNWVDHIWQGSWISSVRSTILTLGSVTFEFTWDPHWREGCKPPHAIWIVALTTLTLSNIFYVSLDTITVISDRSRLSSQHGHRYIWYYTCVVLLRVVAKRPRVQDVVLREFHVKGSCLLSEGYVVVVWSLQRSG